MSVVSIAGVSKHYGAVDALYEVHLTIEDGEFFALLGPSGSGKTTLLRAVAGFVVPDRGEIRVDGEDIRDQPVHRRDIGMVFQHYALFPHMTVADNVAFGLSVRRTAAADVKRRVAEMLELVQLEGLDERKPSQLSGGQQQRVALARALITRPRVLLLDEPLGALDKRLRQQMQIELKQIQREVGITTLFVTHDQEEALTLSDRIALLNDGRVVQSGSPEHVYERPRTHFAADFLGAANFFRGRAAESADGFYRVRTETGADLLTTDILPASDDVLTLAVRPEKLSIARAGETTASRGNQLDGEVVQSVYAGSSITYRVACGADVITVFEQNRSADPIATGEAVSVSWLPEHSVVLDS